MKKTGFIIIVFLYFITRTINLFNIPIFTDEAFYLSFARQINLGLENPFITISHGVPPLLPWILSALLPLNYSNPLLIGRLLSVFWGFMTLIIIFLICQRNFNQKIAYYSVLLYVLMPFALIYDRLCLLDLLLQFLGMITLLLLLEDDFTLKHSIYVAILTTLALFTKSTAYFYLLLIPIVFCFKGLRKYFRQFITVIILILLVMFLRRFLPWSSSIGETNAVYIAGINNFIQNPFNYLITNLRLIKQWLLFYWDWGVIFFFILGLFYLPFKHNRKIKIIFIWFFLPIFIEIFIAKYFFPRHFFFTTASLVIYVGFFLDYLSSKINNGKLIYIFLFLFFLPLLFKDYILLVDINKANLPVIEKWQFFEGWPSGYGADKMVDFVKQQITTGPAEILVEKYGLPYYVLMTYLMPNKNLSISNALSAQDPPKDIANLFVTDRENKFIILNEMQKIPKEWQVDKIVSYPKINKQTSISIYKINDE